MNIFNISFYECLYNLRFNCDKVISIKRRITKYTYPGIFENGDGKIGFRVSDISGGFTFEYTTTETIEITENTIAMMLVHYVHNRQAIPEPSNISAVKAKDRFVN